MLDEDTVALLHLSLFLSYPRICEALISFHLNPQIRSRLTIECVLMLDEDKVGVLHLSFLLYVTGSAWQLIFTSTRRSGSD